MTQHPTTTPGPARHLLHLALAAAVVLGSACGAAGGRDEYANDGDTGAASPAGGGYDASTAEKIGRDTSLGTNARTGEPGVAGDTMGGRGMPAGRTDSATRATLKQRTPPPPPPPR